MSADVKQVESWVRSEAERYAAVIEQRHHLEIDAFVEQLRLKDEKLEAFRWRLLSMELESKRLQSHVEGLNKELLQLRHSNLKMEALLLKREEEVTSLKEQFVAELRSINCQKNNSSSQDSAETKTIFVEISQEEGTKRDNEIPAMDQSRSTDVILTVQSPDKEIEEKKYIVSPEGPPEEGSSSPVEVYVAEIVPSPTQQHLNKAKTSQWRMDLHALGVSYKLKRLKQQLIMLERLRGNQDRSEDNKETNDNGGTGTKGFLSLMSVLNKQVGRYQSFQSKVDDLCKRMVSSDS